MSSAGPTDRESANRRRCRTRRPMKGSLAEAWWHAFVKSLAPASSVSPRSRVSRPSPERELACSGGSGGRSNLGSSRSRALSAAGHGIPQGSLRAAGNCLSAGSSWPLPLLHWLAAGARFLARCALAGGRRRTTPCHAWKHTDAKRTSMTPAARLNALAAALREMGASRFLPAPNIQRALPVVDRRSPGKHRTSR